MENYIGHIVVMTIG